MKGPDLRAILSPSLLVRRVEYPTTEFATPLGNFTLRVSRFHQRFLGSSKKFSFCFFVYFVVCQVNASREPGYQYQFFLDYCLTFILRTHRGTHGLQKACTHVTRTLTSCSPRLNACCRGFSSVQHPEGLRGSLLFPVRSLPSQGVFWILSGSCWFIVLFFSLPYSAGNSD